MGQTIMSFNEMLQVNVKLDYLLHLPEGYKEEGGEKWPLIVFLHGAGERGSDINKVKIHGIPKIAENRKDFPFVAVSPQCSDNSNWNLQMERLKLFIDEIVRRYNIDENRVYLTGLSMGGYGTWNLAIAYPEMFAAIAPICGGGMAWQAANLKSVPVWVFHGAKDSVVPISESESMVKALEECAADVRFTVYPEANHDSWTETYNNSELYKWFLSHPRK